MSTKLLHDLATYFNGPIASRLLVARNTNGASEDIVAIHEAYMELQRHPYRAIEKEEFLEDGGNGMFSGVHESQR